MRLTMLVVAPLIGAGLIAVTPKDALRPIRMLAVIWSLLTAIIGIAAVFAYRPDTGGYQMVEKYDWISGFGASWHLGIDGISLWLVALTVVLFPLCIIAAWDTSDRPKMFFATLLVIESAVLGVFLSLDLLLFYVFWEAVLVPMYLLIGVWGYERRVYATVKFFLFTLLGGLIMLVGVVVLHVKAQTALGAPTFDYTMILQATRDLDPGTAKWLFGAFTFAFAIKIPMFGLHTWLPDAHTEAPTVGSVILAGVLLKMGTYGLLRYSIPMFPEQAKRYAPLMIALAVIGILYGAAVSVVQRDLKKLIAYSSVSHLGFVVLGLFAFTLQAAQGATLQMVNHGLSTGMLFLLVGMLYQRRHTRAIADFGGLSQSVPIFAGLFLFASFASLGLPGLNGFVGEFMILVGSFRTYPVAASLAALGVVIAALYLLWAYQRVFNGPVVDEANRNVPELTTREKLVLIPLAALIVVIGVWPKPFLDRSEASVRDTYGSLLSGEPATKGLTPVGHSPATDDHTEPTAEAHQ